MALLSGICARPQRLKIFRVDFDFNCIVMHLTFSTEIKYLAVCSGVRIALSLSVVCSRCCNYSRNEVLLLIKLSMICLKVCLDSLIPF